MTEAEGRLAVWAEALSWLGTPWHHEARVKGVGVDCAQFLIGAFAGAGIVEPFDTGSYPRDWHVHRDVERMVPIVLRFCDEIDDAEPLMADIFVCKIGRVYSHAGIVGPWPQGAHASVADRCVCLCDLDRDLGLISGPRRFFRFKGWANGR